jgi:hypothetical protein
VTATLDAPSRATDVIADRPCECKRHSHHPGNRRFCGQSARYAVRIQHAIGCGTNGVRVFLMCQDCLDDALRWANTNVGKFCRRCHKRVLKVSDLIRSVVKL